ncbi:hypothetical protein E1281_14655 [Actinomadura sp. KC345]|uniref:hypothetical protein n=1 Tax=Actinomadura sp. KC345 TaxID=2530371 RepID=UPI0010438B11|nr:hypothetical protein [Actinomadura sp. KC345]TDC55052.1 hypothetical protein E1281_14655 [Actinomadura sp. KC345]
MPRTIKIAVVIVAAIAVMAAPVAAETTTEPEAARVSGSGQIRLTYWPDQDVRAFTFDARAVPYSEPKPGAPDGLPTDARGTVKIYHHSPGGGWTVRSEAKVDCLLTSPGNATLTAVVTKADEPIKDKIGQRLGFSVHDGGPGGRHDRMGFSWSVVNGVENGEGGWEEGKVGTCMGPAAFAPVTKGAYNVRHADLLPVPKG